MSDITEDNTAASNLRVSRVDAPAPATMRDRRIARQAELEPLCQAAVPPIPAPNRDQGPKAVRAQGSGRALFVLSVLSLILLTFLCGLWVTWKAVWPFEPHVREALLGFEAIWETYAVPRDPMNTDVWRRVSSSDQAKGVTTFIPAKAFDGYTLVTFGESAALIDMGGTVLHQWHSPTRELEELGVRREESTPDTWDYWRPARLLPNGDLIAIVDRMHSTPEGLALIKLDRQSRPIWIYVHAVHHDFDIDQNGNIYVLDQQLRVEPIPGLPALVPPFIDEGILVLSPTGQQLTRISITESFQLSDYRPLLNEFARINRDHWGDYLHSNNLDLVDDDLAAAFEFLEEGQVLLSFREISTIAALDLDQKRIVWAARGQWHMQHDPDLLANGNMLVFDNQGDWARSGSSRVIEFDPVSREVVWQYPRHQDQRMDNRYRAGQQKLPNGNVLINDFYQGRLLEVTEAGEIVWEYHCPFAHPERADLVCRPMSAWRYGRDELPFLVGDHARGATAAAQL